MRRSALAGSTSTHRATPSLRVTASGCAPPMPPRPAVRVIVPAREPPNRRPGDLGEALVGALQDALGADVDPRARRHLPVHRQAEVLEAAELVPRAPLGHQVRVGQQHPRGPLVGAEHPDGLARLHEHRLVVGQRGERPAHGVEGVPGAGGAAGAAVDHEVVGSLGHLRVEVVLQHAEGRFLRPAPARQGRAAGRPDRAWTTHRRSLPSPRGGSGTSAVTAPRAGRP